MATQQASAAPDSAITHLRSCRCACQARTVPEEKFSTMYIRRHGLKSKSLAKYTRPRSSLAAPAAMTRGSPTLSMAVIR